MKIDFGIFGDYLKKQYKKYGYYLKDSQDWEKWEKLRFSINNLYVNGIISDYQREKMFYKLHNKLEKELIKESNNE